MSKLPLGSSQLFRLIHTSSKQLIHCVHKIARKHGQTSRREDQKRILLFLPWGANHRFSRGFVVGCARCFGGKPHYSSHRHSRGGSSAGAVFTILVKSYLGEVKLTKHCYGTWCLEVLCSSTFSRIVRSDMKQELGAST